MSFSFSKLSAEDFLMMCGEYAEQADPNNIIFDGLTYKSPEETVVEQTSNAEIKSATFS